jgi:hypothetical protein
MPFLSEENVRELDAYLSEWIARKFTYSVEPFFIGTIATVAPSAKVGWLVTVLRTEDDTASPHQGLCSVAGYTPQVGDSVLCIRNGMNRFLVVTLLSSISPYAFGNGIPVLGTQITGPLPITFSFRTTHPNSILMCLLSGSGYTPGANVLLRASFTIDGDSANLVELRQFANPANTHLAFPAYLWVPGLHNSAQPQKPQSAKRWPAGSHSIVAAAVAGSYDSSDLFGCTIVEVQTQ